MGFGSEAICVRSRDHEQRVIRVSRAHSLDEAAPGDGDCIRLRIAGGDRVAGLERAAPQTAPPAQEAAP